MPGGAPVALTARTASTMLRTVRPASLCERTRKDLAQDLVRDLCTVDASLAAIERRMSDALDEHGSRLRTVNGVGAITAARLITPGMHHDSTAPTRSRSMRVSPRSRSPAATSNDTDCRAAVTVN